MKRIQVNEGKIWKEVFRSEKIITNQQASEMKLRGGGGKIHGVLVKFLKFD